MSAYHIELVSPEARVLTGSAFAVSIPAAEGEMTVMLGHAPLVCALNAGLVRLYAGSLSEEPQIYFVSGGFCDVSETGCTVLAEEAVLQSQLDGAALDAKMADLRERVAGTEDAAAKDALQKSIAKLQAKRQFVA